MMTTQPFSPLSRPLTALALLPSGLAAIALLACPSARAESIRPHEETIEGTTQRIVLTGLNLHPATPAAARRTYARINRAALEVCGAGDFSLPEVRRALSASPCWREAMKSALAQANNPLISANFTPDR